MDLDNDIPSQVMEKRPKVEKKSLRSAKVSKIGKQLSVVEKPVEGPGAPVQWSKRKHFLEKVSKGKRIVREALEGDVKERAANIKKQKKDAEIVVLKVAQFSEAPNALLDYKRRMLR
ncbi:hypothetical protein HAX54_048727 [Datura stramonium]|uniref:Coiled-coil domain-containing protein 86 n=1 Tax=Datura stramonium TaxID=4076 RepID=A0ABS8SW02_DATST|nr:hypothetical protein [Datura stramonium]